MAFEDLTGGLTQDELQAHWMPFTANRQFKKGPRMILAAQGKY